MQIEIPKGISQFFLQRTKPFWNSRFFRILEFHKCVDTPIYTKYVKCFYFSPEKKQTRMQWSYGQFGVYAWMEPYFRFKNQLSNYIWREREKERERRMNGWNVYQEHNNNLISISCDRQLCLTHSLTHVRQHFNFSYFFWARSRFYKHIARQQTTKSCVFKIPCSHIRQFLSLCWWRCISVLFFVLLFRYGK